MEHMIYYGCEFVATAVKVWLVLQLFACLHDPKMEIKTEQIIWGVATVLLAGLNTYNNSLGFGLFSNSMTFFLSVIISMLGVLLYEARFIRVWYESFVFLVLSALIDFFILALLSVVFQQVEVPTGLLLRAGIFRGIYLLIFSGVLLCATNKIIYWIQKNRQLWKGYWRSRTLVLAAIVIGLFFCMVYFQRIYKLLLSPNYLLLMIFFLMALAFGVALAIAFLTGKKIENREKAQQLKLELMEKKYHEMLAVQTEKEKLLHDTKNHMKAIRLLAEEKGVPEIVRYVDSFCEKAEHAGGKRWTGNVMLDLILNDKISVAEKEHIQVTIVCDKLPDLALSSMEISTLFANLLDNAIEANQSQAEGEERWLHLVCRRQGYMLGVTLTNPIKESFNSDDGFPDTTKEDKAGHGIGLYSIQSVLDSHDGHMKFRAENNIFKLILNFTAFQNME